MSGTNGGRVLSIQADVRDAAGAREVIQTAWREFGGLHVLVNNAGITRDGLLLRMKEEDWNLVLQVNLNGTFHCTKAVLQPMTKQRYGRIVNIASIVGAMGNVGQANYAASKAAVIGFTRATAADWAPHRVTVNAIAPGGFMTAPNQRWQSLNPAIIETFKGQVPMGEFGEPADLAPLAVYLASDASRYMTGAVLVIDGGYTLW